ncbi:MAG: siphovirus Gp157 family protein [Clostridia bacterium]
MKLYEIVKNLEIALENAIDEETGEILNLSAINTLELEKNEMLENLACYYKNLVAESLACKNEKDNFANRQKSAELKAERVKQYIEFCLNGEKFKTEKVNISYRKSERVIVDDIYKLNENFLKYSEPTANKTAIKTAIKSGENVNGANIKIIFNMSIK